VTHEQPRPQLRVVVEQTAPVLGDVASNRSALEAAVRRADADVVVFPELTLTGYCLGYRARELGVPLDGPPPVSLPQGGPVAVFGLVERGEDHLTYNSAMAVQGSRVLAIHRKLYLPTYGSYDEGRVFAPGRRSVRTFPIAPGWSAGILVCEDFWHPSLAYLLALQGADVLFVIVASAGRVVEDAGSGPAFATVESWELIARSTAMLYGMWVVLCNRVGAEDGFTFAGGSTVTDPTGIIVARAPHAEPARLEVTLERERVARARHPFSHLRDEDPAVTMSTLERIVRER